MPSIALDSGPAYALFDRTDKHHRRAADFIASVSAADLVTNVAVITEVSFLLGPSAPTFLLWVARATTIDGETTADLPRIAQFLRKFADLRPDFADAAVMIMCERRGISRIATVDSDFGVYRMKGNRRLINVFPSPS